MNEHDAGHESCSRGADALKPGAVGREAIVADHGNAPASCAETLTRVEATRRSWDAVIIGAGIAGTFIARGLALAGKRVLLVEAKSFPRDKVCGGCLNGRAQQLFAQHGLGDALRRSHPIPLPHLHLVLPRHASHWTLEQPLLSIRRSVLDERLVEAAVAAGADFLPATTARVTPACSTGALRTIQLGPRSSAPVESQATITTHLAICADGLNHPSLVDLPEFRSHVRSDSRVGLQATITDQRGLAESPGLSMVVGQGGYVGVAPVSTGDLHLAAAVDPRRLGDGVRPAELVTTILSEAGYAIPDGLREAAWMGTGPLTRLSGVVAAHRLMLVGDAVGYVEPFTGEGMSWALASATALVPRALQAIEAWDAAIPSLWRRDLQSAVGRHQWLCRGLSRLLRRPRWARVALQLCDALPAIRHRLLQQASGGHSLSLQGHLP